MPRRRTKLNGIVASFRRQRWGVERRRYALVRRNMITKRRRQRRANLLGAANEELLTTQQFQPGIIETQILCANSGPAQAHRHGVSFRRSPDVLYLSLNFYCVSIRRHRRRAYRYPPPLDRRRLASRKMDVAISTSDQARSRFTYRPL